MGGLAADRAQLHNPGGYSVSLNQARVTGSVRLVDGFTSTGLVVLNRSTIKGRLQFTGGSFTCPGPGSYNQHGHAVEAISATVRGGIDLDWAAVAPSVDFTDTTTTFLADDPDTWPPSFDIAGLTYERFETPQYAGRPSRSGIRPPGAPGWAGRRSSTRVPTSRPPGCSVSTATPTRRMRS